MRTLFLPLTGLLLSGSLLASAAQADEPRYNQISLQTQVEQAVNHDTMQVTFYAEAQDRDPAKLAETVTQRLNAGLQTARQSQNIRVSSGSRSSHPVYDEKGENIIAWRERGELNIEGSDFAAISALTGELLGDLSLGSMQFSLSADSRRETEDQLIAKAIEAFKARADIATRSLGGSDYKIVNLNLNTQYMQPVRYRAEKLMMASDAAGSAPQVEGGQSDVSVSANGVIEVRD
ncbi:SIMPL domain-containing protein [Pseudomonas sp.]|uniref:SIMPL domain-containing protein n=1 Tax=Pseudomonas sp. TaxID=306 RepID=UPI003CC5790B